MRGSERKGQGGVEEEKEENDMGKKSRTHIN